MSASFLDHIGDVEDPRVPGMVVYPLDEILLTVLVGLLCRAEDFDDQATTGRWVSCGSTRPENALESRPYPDWQ